MNSVNEYRGVWVFSERHDLALELLGKGRELADTLQTELAGIVIGSQVKDKADELAKHGADKVYLIENPDLRRFQAEAFLSILHNLASNYHPEILLIGSTRNGKPLAARLATRLDTGCIPDCTGLGIDEDRNLIGERITYGGNATAKIQSKSRPHIATVPSRTFERPAAQNRNAQIVKLEVKIEEPKTQLVETNPLKASSMKVEEAQYIVSCGRGLEKKDDQALLEELAEILGGQVGCSRPLVEDRKWFTDWVGLSGHKVKPKLYIAAGISGVIQHVAGIRDSKVIVAINKDPEAPIFEIADYAVVGNLYEILPALKDALRKQIH